MNSIKDETEIALLKQQLEEFRKENDALKRKNSKLQTDLEEIEARTYIDGLTGLYNASYYHKIFRELICAIENQARNGGCCSVISMDINNLKHVNDSEGHSVADEGIIEIVNTIEANLTKYPKIFFRTGGDEFIVIVPSVPKEVLKKDIIQIHTVIEENKENLHGLGIAIGLGSTEDKEFVLRELDPKQQKKVSEYTFDYIFERMPNRGNVKKQFVSNKRSDKSLQSLIDIAEERMYKDKDNAKTRISSDKVVENIMRTRIMAEIRVSTRYGEILGLLMKRLEQEMIYKDDQIELE